MESLKIQGGYKLIGNIEASGSKNESLPIMFASILADSPIFLRRIPNLMDIRTTMTILSQMGINVIQTDNGHIIEGNKLSKCLIDHSLVKTMRASILALGPLLSRYGSAVVSLPGGCSIGDRPINWHLKGLEDLGAKIKIDQGNIIAEAKKLKGTKVLVNHSVTATENIIMAATLAEGITTIKDAALEPEIVSLANFLNKMGAKIKGYGTKTITISGVKKLQGVEYDISSDRIESATYLVAAAMTGGHITINNTNPENMYSSLEKLKEAGANIKIYNTKNIEINMQGRKLKAVNITTSTYPGFVTDMQAQFTALNVIADGSSRIEENIFEKRFQHVAELKRFGGDIWVEKNIIFCHGKKEITGTRVMASDLRASASLVLASLVAKGESIIERVYHLDRGYEIIEEKLVKIGAKIDRINE